jgi:hypothetical protein
MPTSNTQNQTINSLKNHLRFTTQLNVTKTKTKNYTPDQNNHFLLKCLLKGETGTRQTTLREAKKSPPRNNEQTKMFPEAESKTLQLSWKHRLELSNLQTLANSTNPNGRMLTKTQQPRKTTQT